MKNTKTALYNLDFFLKLLHYVAIKAKYTSIEDKWEYYLAFVPSGWARLVNKSEKEYTSA